jgi:hypothetical protein
MVAGKLLLDVSAAGVPRALFSRAGTAGHAEGQILAEFVEIARRWPANSL